MKILIVGEGKTEIGYWTLPLNITPRKRHATNAGSSKHLLPAYAPAIGRSSRESIGGESPKYTARRSDDRGERNLGPEGQTVLGLVLRAEEKNCNAVIFVRDRDDEAEREKEIKDAIDIARKRFTPKIAGGVAAQETESWLLSLKGEKDAERYGTPTDVLRKKYGVESLTDKVAIVDNANLDEVRADAQSLQIWLAQVRLIMNVSSDTNET